MDSALLAYGWLGLALTVWIGLCVGSFLNVVIYRLPVMLNRQWHAEASEFLAAERRRLPERLRPASPPPMRGRRSRST
jgi:leader peptidase (prepilin peptidase) / N-methyltransferase